MKTKSTRMQKRKQVNVTSFSHKAANKRQKKDVVVETYDVTSEDEISESESDVSLEKPQELLHDNDDSEDDVLDSVQDELFDNGNQHTNTLTDQYSAFIGKELKQDELDALRCKYQHNEFLSWQYLHKIIYMQRGENKDDNAKSLNQLPCNLDSEKNLLTSFAINKTLASNWVKLNETNGDEICSGLQAEMFTLLQSYVSVLYPSYSGSDTVNNMQNIMCLHALNHVLRSREEVLKNNTRLSKMSTEQIEQAEYRDQGITRPKVLILVPFRDMAYSIINKMISLLERNKKTEVSFRKRFKQEFSYLPDDTLENSKQSLDKKPEDYQLLFAGNTDECFRIGIALLRNSVRLYSPFYSSDIIFASPLGLRTIIGEKGESHYEHDFLSSIELFILDHADVFLMQNWEHILHITKHLHLRPKDSHGVDFSRVRHSALDGQSKHYCQFVVFSSIASPLIGSLLTRYCNNHCGLAMIKNVVNSGTICSIPKQIPQMFHRLDVSVSYSKIQNTRFEFFISNVLKQCKEKKMSRVLIYIPQYFDFVRVRNHMRREKKSASGPHFGHICEYTKPTEVGKARRRFLTEKFPIMLYTERYHFYHRPNIKGIRHLVFFELPTYPHFYSELCNMISSSAEDMSLSSTSIITLYSKYDVAKVISVLGDRRADELMKSPKNVHMFLTDHQT
ncbi:U3 small nucleolar RNA-associated protein 25 homolog [Clavelina lepadiformis]|uniref:U3 small nucleolar RNA-associated protein 25 homolog n=1 Tax=Clavelina lepadiformis TaxID=159417 RepID=A0ABP0F2Q1_CLALP